MKSINSAKDHLINQPFSSKKQKIFFITIICFFISLPVIMHHFELYPDKVELYKSIPNNYGPYHSFSREIFKSKDTLDLLFIGSSLLWTGIDDQYISKMLSEINDSDINVKLFGINWRGEDILYYIIRDIVENLPVKRLILSMPTTKHNDNNIHNVLYRFLQYPHYKDYILGLNSKYNFIYYAASILSAPRQLITNFKKENTFSNYENFDQIGSYKVNSGFNGAPFKYVNRKNSNYFSEKNTMYSFAESNFKFQGPDINEYQKHYIGKIFELLENNDIKTAIIHIPKYSERESDKISERVCWPKTFDTKVDIIGIKPNELFKSMSEDSIKYFYYDEHLNSNGNEYFTESIFPAIAKFYEKD